MNSCSIFAFEAIQNKDFIRSENLYGGASGLFLFISQSYKIIFIT